MNSVHPKPALPLVRLSLLLPFVEELDRRGLETNAVLKASGLVRDALFDPDGLELGALATSLERARAAGDGASPSAARPIAREPVLPSGLPATSLDIFV